MTSLQRSCSYVLRCIYHRVGQAIVPLVCYPIGRMCRHTRRDRSAQHFYARAEHRSIVHLQRLRIGRQSVVQGHNALTSINRVSRIYNAVLRSFFSIWACRLGSSRAWFSGRRENRRRSCRLYGGERGIRTLDTGLSPYNALAGRPLRPLGHLSEVRGILHAPGDEQAADGLQLPAPPGVEARILQAQAAQRVDDDLRND